VAVQWTIVRVNGPGTFRYGVVGESQYNAALRRILRDRGYELAAGGEHKCDAILVREPDNQYDPNAVAVFIEGHKVGYIPRLDAEDMAESLDELEGRGQRACLAAEIGWGDPAVIGVRLDLEHD